MSKINDAIYIIMWSIFNIIWLKYADENQQKLE